VIFKASDESKLTVSSSADPLRPVHYFFQQNAYNSSALYSRIIADVYCPALASIHSNSSSSSSSSSTTTSSNTAAAPPNSGRPTALWLHDSASLHLTEEVQRTAQQHNLQLLTIPERLTAVLQPVDVGVAKGVRHRVEAASQAHVAADRLRDLDNIPTHTAGDWRVLLLQWCRDAVYGISDSAAKQAFITTGIAVESREEALRVNVAVDEKPIPYDFNSHTSHSAEHQFHTELVITPATLHFHPTLNPVRTVAAGDADEDGSGGIFDAASSAADEEETTTATTTVETVGKDEKRGRRRPRDADQAEEAATAPAAALQEGAPPLKQPRRSQRGLTRPTNKPALYSDEHDTARYEQAVLESVIELSMNG
jgi:hypothetical protein